MQSHQALIAQASTTRAVEVQLAKMAEDYVAAGVASQKDTLEEIMEFVTASHPKSKSIRHTKFLVLHNHSTLGSLSSQVTIYAVECA